MASSLSFICPILSSITLDGLDLVPVTLVYTQEQHCSNRSKNSKVSGTSFGVGANFRPFSSTLRYSSVSELVRSRTLSKVAEVLDFGISVGTS